MNNESGRQTPILFACSGCSNAGHVAYDLALELDRREVAEMSCLAGVAAEKPVFLRKLANREAWVVDGCPIHCGLGVFERLNYPVGRHIRLADFGIKKAGTRVDSASSARLADEVLESMQSPMLDARTI